MRRVLGGAILLFLIAPLLPTFAADEDKDAQKPPVKVRLVALGQLVGKVTSVAGSNDRITLQVSSDRLQPKRSGRRSSYQIKQSSQKLELQVAEDVKVRTLNAPITFDDKGNPTKYSSTELKELKGSGNLPGYAADFSSLKTGQVVEVYLARKRKNTAARETRSDGQANADKPIITMIVIRADK